MQLTSLIRMKASSTLEELTMNLTSDILTWKDACMLFGIEDVEQFSLLSYLQNNREVAYSHLVRYYESLMMK